MAESGKVQGAANQADSAGNTSADKTPDAEVNAPEEQAVAPASSHGMRWLLLLVIVVIPLLGWLLTPTDTRQQWLDMLMPHTSPQHSGDTDVAPTSRVVAPVAPVSKQTPPEPVSAMPVQAPKPRVETPIVSRSFNSHATPPAATSKEIKALTAAIHKLQNEVELLQGKEEGLLQLSRKLDARQRLELRARLRWIANARSQLPQITVFWQDILLLPILSDDQRREAEAMRKLAADDTAHLEAWRQTLEKLAATLPDPKQRDIIPKPENPAFSWLTGKIHLHPAPTAEQQRSTQLRARLLHVSHVLNVEVWPSGKQWRHLLADLRERFGDDAALALPEHLDGIQKDIATMRKKAADWLEQS